MGCRSMRGPRSRRKRESGHKRHGRQRFWRGLSQPLWRAYATVREGSRPLSASNRRLGAA